MTDNRNLHFTESLGRQNGAISFLLLSFHPHLPQDHNAESLNLDCLSIRLFPWLRSVLILRFMYSLGAIHSTTISGNFGPKLNGSVRSNRKSFEKTGPPFEVDQFSRSHRLEFWLNGSRPLSRQKLLCMALAAPIRLLS